MKREMLRKWRSPRGNGGKREEYDHAAGVQRFSIICFSGRTESESHEYADEDPRVIIVTRLQTYFRLRALLVDYPRGMEVGEMAIQ
jgi:hypothetical protein